MVDDNENLFDDFLADDYVEPAIEGEPRKRREVSKEPEEVEEEDEEEEKPKEKKTPKIKDLDPTEEEEEDDNDEEEDEEEEEEEDDNKQAEEFWAVVREQAKIPEDVQLEDGVDPLSPEAVVSMLDKTKEHVRNDILDQLKSNFPTTWKTLQAEQQGIDPFKQYRSQEVSSNDFLDAELKEDNDKLNENVIRHFLKSRDFSDKYADTLINNFKDEGILYEQAKEAQGKLKKEEDSRKQKAMEDANRQAEETKKRDQQLIGSITSKINDGKIGNFKITSNEDKQELSEFIVKHLRRGPENSYYISLDVEDANMEQLLQTMFFMKKKGDLSKYVERAAESKSAKLRMKAKAKSTRSSKEKEQSRGNTKISDL